MKRNAFLCLCLCLCLLVSACATPTPAPEESDLPAEESSESLSPIPEDPNAKAVRADLEELLGKEWKPGDETVEWLSADRVETIRDRVKQLNAPILTQADVLRMAGQAATVAILLQQYGSRFPELPACGVMAGLSWYSAPIFEAFYTALLSYTLYLFTPPDYLFRENEVGFSLTAEKLCLYLPLALPEAAYTSRSEALALLQNGKNGVELPLSSLSDGEHPLDFNFSRTPVLLSEDGDSRSLELYEMATQGVDYTELSEEFRVLYAEAYVQKWINRCSSLSISFTGLYNSYQTPDGSWSTVYILLTPEEAREVRKMVELLPSPILTEEEIRLLQISMYWRLGYDYPLLLPGIDGQPDSLMWPEQEDSILLAQQAAGFLIDLFTPSAYRYAGLLGRYSGYSYALRAPEGRYDSPEAALRDFTEGRTRFLWADAGVPYFIDRDGNIELPAQTTWKVVTY